MYKHVTFVHTKGSCDVIFAPWNIVYLYRCCWHANLCKACNLVEQCQHCVSNPVGMPKLKKLVPDPDESDLTVRPQQKCARKRAESKLLPTHQASIDEFYISVAMSISIETQVIRLWSWRAWFHSRGVHYQSLARVVVDKLADTWSELWSKTAVLCFLCQSWISHQQALKVFALPTLWWSGSQQICCCIHKAFLT